MPGLVHYIPIVTTLFSLPFAWMVLQRYRAKGRGAHLVWWAAGIFLYGVGTFTESWVTLLGWHPAVFRAWYISGALLGGAPLAQGTVYLLFSRRTANRMTMILLPVIAVAAVLVLLTPLRLELVEAHRLSGQVIAWQFVRWFSPFINTYAFIFLVGGAILSAYRFHRDRQMRHRFVGNVLIAVGALLPGIGGTFARMGYTEVLYVTELIGIVLIYLGYRANTSTPSPVPAARQPVPQEGGAV